MLLVRAEEINMHFYTKPLVQILSLKITASACKLRELLIQNMTHFAHDYDDNMPQMAEYPSVKLTDLADF